MRKAAIPCEPRSILLVRLTARGDVVFSSSLVGALRRTYPHARISWLGESHTKELIEHHPELHRVFSWDRGRWKRLLKAGRIRTLAGEAIGLLRSLRSERFDLVLDLQGLFRSGVASYLTGAPCRIVLRPREGSQVFATHVFDRRRDQGNRWEIASEYRFLADQLGLDTSDFRMEVHLHARDRAFVRTLMEGHGLEGGYAVAVPHASRPRKHWFEDRWAGLVEGLQRDLGLRTILLGGPADTVSGHRIRGQARCEPLCLEGKTTLAEAAAVIEQAHLVIGVDTGLTHVAVALDRPTVGIFGARVPYTKTFKPNTRILTHWLDCVPCDGNPVCNGALTCVREISVGDVLRVAGEVLNGNGVKPSSPPKRGLQPQGGLAWPPAE